MPSSGNINIGNNDVTGMGTASLIHQITIQPVMPQSKLALLLKPGIGHTLNSSKQAGPASIHSHVRRDIKILIDAVIVCC
jgi:hypothetical protein